MAQVWARAPDSFLAGSINNSLKLAFNRSLMPRERSNLSAVEAAGQRCFRRERIP
jgi:hypothetical protein